MKSATCAAANFLFFEFVGTICALRGRANDDEDGPRRAWNGPYSTSNHPHGGHKIRTRKGGKTLQFKLLTFLIVAPR